MKHHAAMPVAEVPAFMREVRARDDISARALEFLILTAARTNETIGARRAEVDLAAKEWIVPAARMKGAREHIVPLSARACEIIASLPKSGGYLFPGAVAGKPLSNMAMLELLRGMRSGLTVHGFRSAFRDWAGDRTTFAREVIEFALAHGIKDETEAAYRRSTAIEKRRKLMAKWCEFCRSTDSTSAKIIPIGRGRK